jgi:hypothetical protein
MRMAPKEEVERENFEIHCREWGVARVGVCTLMYLSNQSHCYNTWAASHCIYARSKPQHMDIRMVLE